MYDCFVHVHFNLYKYFSYGLNFVHGVFHCAEILSLNRTPSFPFLLLSVLGHLIYLKKLGEASAFNSKKFKVNLAFSMTFLSLGSEGMVYVKREGQKFNFRKENPRV